MTEPGAGVAARHLRPRRHGARPDARLPLRGVPPAGRHGGRRGGSPALERRRHRRRGSVGTWAEEPGRAAAEPRGGHLGGASRGSVGHARGRRQGRRVVGLRCPVRPAGRWRRGVRRGGRRAGPGALGPASGSAAGPAELLATRPARCPPSPPTGCGCCPRAARPPEGSASGRLTRYALPAGTPRSTSRGTRRRPAGRATGQQQSNVLLHARGRCASASVTSDPCRGRSGRAENEPFGIFEFAPTEAFDLDLVERTLRGAARRGRRRRRGDPPGELACRSATSSRWRRCSPGTASAC